MNQKPVVNYPLRFAFLLGLMGVFMVFTAFLVPFIGSRLMHVDFRLALHEMNKPEYANISRLLNTMASLLVFFLPSLALGRLLNKHPFAELGFNSHLNSKQLLLILGLTVSGILLSGALGELNEWLPIPDRWYIKARQMENEYRDSMMGMATMKSAVDYVLSLLVMAAAPAFFEEVLFRGSFQQVFIGWTKSKWMGLLITSILFSVIHFSWFGFLPRLALGMILGTVFLYSRNIWLNIFLHFMYNGLIVTQLYLSGRLRKPVSKTMDENLPIWWGIFALLIVLILLRAFKRESEDLLNRKKESIHSSPENMFS
jgi:membrane protease YdiL (CAAX protease family)